MKAREVWLLTQGCGKAVFASLGDAKAEAQAHEDVVRWRHPRPGLWCVSEDLDGSATQIECLSYHPKARRRPQGDRP